VKCWNSAVLIVRWQLSLNMPHGKCLLTLRELAHDMFVLRFRPEDSCFLLPHQRHSSSANCSRELVKSSNRSARVVVWSQKKFFGWGLWIFCEWRHKWSSFGVILGHHVAWPRAQPLGQSVSLKFSLETRLKSWVFWAFDRLSSVSGSK